MSAEKKGAAEEKTVAVGEYKVNVASAGSGPTVVMLHGEDKKPSWKDWEGFLGLSESYRLIIPDLVGFGKSSHPGETPDYRAQARVVHELLDVMKVDRATLVGYSWGGQVALEVAIGWPERVESLILVASTYDKGQLPMLSKIRRPSLVVWAEDDLVTQLKAGYLLRDALRTSRLEVLAPVAKDPKFDFTIAHTLLVSRREELLKLFRSFLSSPASATAEPPELEKELRGLAMKQDGESP
jgi:alpha-beta hydrolase superfamily lysophospholipase